MRHIRSFALAAAVAVTSLLPAAAHADRPRPGERFTVYARVIDVRPVYREVRFTEPRRECWTEQRSRNVRQHARAPRQTRSGGDALVGGVIGGVIGNQIGRNASGGARAGATVAGAIVGAAITNESGANRGRHRRDPYRPSVTVRETRPVQRCRTVQETRYERRLQHYDVTYRYEGRTLTTSLPNDPGPRLELQVTAAPSRR